MAMRQQLLQLGCTAILLTIARVTGGQGPEKCYLEVAAGNCSEQLQRWYFDNRTGLCQPFTYTGCGGNDNNFNSTAYCYHACNASTDGGHSYSIEDSAEKLKSQQGVGDGAETTPTDFSRQKPPQFTTRQPTLIRNQPGTGQQQQQQQPRHPAAGSQDNRAKRRRRDVRREVRRRRKTSVDQDAKYDVRTEDEFDESAQWNDDLRAKTYTPVGRRGASHRYDDEYSGGGGGADYSYYYDADDVGNSLRQRSRRGRGDVVTELLAQMQLTSALMERFVAAATTNLHNTPTGRRRPTPKNAHDVDGSVPATTSTAPRKTSRAVSDYFRARRPTADTESLRTGASRSRHHPQKNSRRRGDLAAREHERRLLHVTLLGRLERVPPDDRRGATPQVSGAAGTAQKPAKVRPSPTSRKNDANVDDTSEVQSEQQQQQRLKVSASNTTPGDHHEEDPDDDDDIEIMGDRIRTIIADPDSSFTYDNISNDDMVSLEEMMSQSSQIGTMKLVDSDDEKVASAEAEDKQSESAAAQPSDGDVMAKLPREQQQVAGAPDNTESAQTAAADAGDSAAKAI